MRKVIFKEFIPFIYLDKLGGEHDTYAKANTVNQANKEPGYTSVNLKPNTGKYGDFEKEGLFHTWSISGDEEGTQPIAIIELIDGTIVLIPAENIKFVD